MVPSLGVNIAGSAAKFAGGRTALTYDGSCSAPVPGQGGLITSFNVDVRQVASRLWKQLPGQAVVSLCWM